MHLEDQEPQRLKDRPQPAKPAKCSPSSSRPSLPPWREPFGAVIAPQLATLVDALPSGDDWLYEIKFDGYRAISTVSAGRVCVMSRNGYDWSQKLARVGAALTAVPCEQAVLDGEVVALRPDGTSDFQLLQNVLREGVGAPLFYYVFDLLALNGEDWRGVPLAVRKERLRALLSSIPADGVIRLSDHAATQGADILQQACEHGLEGVVAKRAESLYQSRRSLDWIKIKCSQRQEFVVGGFTEPEGSREYLGALLLGTFDAAGQLVYAGRVGTGFNGASLAQLHEELAPLITHHTPFAQMPRGAATVHWVRPERVVEVQFSNWTRDGMLRHPSFLGMRQDKPARSVGRERPLSTAVAVKAQRAAKSAPETTATPARTRHQAPPDSPAPSTQGVPSRRQNRHAAVTLTHASRRVYPEAGLTKQDIADYYAAVAERMLPYVAQRPLTVVRCPRGHGDSCFFQRHFRMDDARHVHTGADSGGESFCYIGDLDGLLALVQHGVLEIHTWGSRISHLEHPDSMVFDLDPGPNVHAGQLVRAAQHVRSLLAAQKLRSFLKRTGGHGLHVVVPLAPTVGWDASKTFAHSVATRLAAEQPTLYTASARKAERLGKVFIDYLRNARGNSAVAVYSTRARDGAPVALPMAWDDLTAHALAKPTTLQEAIASIDGPDPWADYAGTRQVLQAELATL